MKTRVKPLIKYYSFSSKGEKNTCYDGKYDFLRHENKEAKKLVDRFYPDEFLIAHILDKYLKARPQKSEHRKVILLTESWSGNGGERDGSSNTTVINEQILAAIKKFAGNESKQENTLILAPFLYGYHHPGIAIDVKNKIVIYVDPKGWVPAHYPETRALKEALEKEGFNFIVVGVAQQRSSDMTSCGPILTASMIKFIEEFIKSGAITSNDFEANKKKSCNRRMFQMYINNTVESKGRSPDLQETMLADESLWDEFFAEQRINRELANLTITAIRAHKLYIQKSLNTINLKKIQFIRDFQSRMIELVLLQPQQVEKIQSLANVGSRLLTSNEDEIAEQISTPPILMEEGNFPIVQSKLGLGASKSSIVEAKGSEKVISTQHSHSLSFNTLVDTFIDEHESQYKSGCCTNTNLSSYDSLTSSMILAHAKATTLFGYKNRTCLILEKMKVIDENGILLKPEFKTAINNRKKA